MRRFARESEGIFFMGYVQGEGQTQFFIEPRRDGSRRRAHEDADAGGMQFVHDTIHPSEFNLAARGGKTLDACLRRVDLGSFPGRL